MVGVGIAEFWDLTPAEFGFAVQGYARRVEDQRKLAAWHVCFILNAWKGKGAPITPRRLLGGRVRNLSDFESAEAFKAAVDKDLLERDSD